MTGVSSWIFNTVPCTIFYLKPTSSYIFSLWSGLCSVVEETTPCVTESRDTRFLWSLTHVTRTAVWPRQSLYFALYSPLSLSMVWTRRGETNCMHKAKSVFYWEKNTKTQVAQVWILTEENVLYCISAPLLFGGSWLLHLSVHLLMFSLFQCYDLKRCLASKTV